MGFNLIILAFAMDSACIFLSDKCISGMNITMGFNGEVKISYGYQLN